MGASLLARVRECCSPAQAGPRQRSQESAETVQALRTHHGILIQAPHPLASQQGQNDGGRFQASPVGKASRYESSEGQYGFFRGRPVKQRNSITWQSFALRSFWERVADRQTDQLASYCRLTLGTKWTLTSL